MVSLTWNQFPVFLRGPRGSKMMKRHKRLLKCDVTSGKVTWLMMLVTWIWTFPHLQSVINVADIVVRLAGETAGVSLDQYPTGIVFSEGPSGQCSSRGLHWPWRLCRFHAINLEAICLSALHLGTYEHTMYILACVKYVCMHAYMYTGAFILLILNCKVEL